jgi:hypothetical protein
MERLNHGFFKCAISLFAGQLKPNNRIAPDFVDTSEKLLFFHLNKAEAAEE